MKLQELVDKLRLKNERIEAVKRLTRDPEARRAAKMQVRQLRDECREPLESLLQSAAGLKSKYPAHVLWFRGEGRNLYAFGDDARKAAAVVGRPVGTRSVPILYGHGEDVVVSVMLRRFIPLAIVDGEAMQVYTPAAVESVPVAV